MHAAGTTTVQRLRLRLLATAPALASTGARSPDRPTNAGAEATRAQQVVQGWLAGLEPGRYGLPAQAIVVVRRVQTGLPALVPGSPWPDPLASMLRSAARPAAAPFVGAAAAAVWFSDEAELLACLARDAHIGQPAWWWPLLLGRQPDAALALARWCGAAQHIPRAMQQLGAVEGRAWLQGLGATARGDLLRAVSGAFPVCAEAQADVAGAEDAGAALRDDGPATTDAAAPAGGPVAEVRADRPPVVGLRLHELLQALADDAMAASTPRRSVPEGRGAVPAATPAPAPLPLIGGAALRDAAQPVPGTPLSSAPGPAAVAPHCQATSPFIGLGRHASPAADARAHGPAHASASATPVAPVSPHLSDPATLAPAAPHPVPPAQPLRTEAPAAAQTHLDTELGGLFFLLNMALALGLYGDFTQPRRLGLALTPWQFLHAAALAWAGHAYSSDALAPWLQAQADAHPWPAAAMPAPAGSARARKPLADLAPMLRQRLAQALGLRSARRALAMTLRLHASLQARPGRVDLHFDLATLPLALRLAGLDRDPGWIPAAGCDFRFHFH